MLTILSSLAENESISISQNNKWSIQRRFRNGTFKLSSPPYGYDYEDGILIVNEEQAAVVRRIFSEALSGKGAQKIADNLNADGISPKKAALWNASTILGMLSNEKYTGDVILQKTYTDDHFKRHRNNGEKDQIMIRRNHEAIISHEEFDAVNELLRQRGDEKGIEKGKVSTKRDILFPAKSYVRSAEVTSNAEFITMVEVNILLGVVQSISMILQSAQCVLFVRMISIRHLLR